MRLRGLVALLLAGCLTACARSTPRVRRAAEPSAVRTVDSVPLRPAALQPPVTLTDEGPAPRPKSDLMQAGAPPPPTPRDEALRAALPFAPAIAMDPVDGSKISIRVATPKADYKGHLYYFSSDTNKRTFLNKPDQFTKGLFSRL